MAIQPIVAGVLGFVIFPLVESTSRLSAGGSAIDPWDAAVAFSLGVSIVAFGVTLLGVLPIVAWRLSRGPFTLKEILFAGLLLGNAPGLLIIALANLHRQTTSAPSGVQMPLRAVVAGSFFGLAGAAVFWFVALRGSIYDARRRASQIPSTDVDRIAR